MTTRLLGICRPFKLLAATILLAGITGTSLFAQDNNTHQMRDEYYGHTLNLGLGVAYGGYYGGQSVPYFTANYEFDVARSFTLAPFIGIASFTSTNGYYDNGYYGPRYYYHETVIPIGVKGSYYFDRALGLNRKWDLYLAASLGFTYSHQTWDDGYTGNRDAGTTASPLYLDVHIGGEYHVNRRIGLFADLSTGVSTVGLAIHGHR